MRPFNSGRGSISQGSCPHFHLPLKRLKSKLDEGIEMADETKSLKMKDINEVLSDYKIQNMEGVVLVGDIEIEMDLFSGMLPSLEQSLGQECTKIALQLLNLSRAMGYPADGMLSNATTRSINE